ncbi:MAG: epoxyqueuosine reductase QueH [Bacteroidales bacterium]|jgi:predicted adenine nucleotide alpha hydrolase (AANH) superfamily ATPase
MPKRTFLKKPADTAGIVLHSCCAPCSTALVDCLLEHDITPVIFYYNPNIYPQEEYDIRKAENKRYAQALGLDFVDADYNHEEWKAQTWDLRNEPEKGKRCFYCFQIRLAETARFTKANGYSLFATTLATSRWKDLEQINQAGTYAAGLFPGITFWTNNWRKNGLTERQSVIIRQYDFYRQQYCGCEYSLRDSNRWRKENGKKLIRSLQYHK